MAAYSGELLALLAAVMFALANVTISLGAVRRKGDNGALLSVMVTAAVALLIWLIVGPRAVDTTAAVLAPALLWFALSGLLATVFGRIFLFRSIRELGAVKASALKRLTPFFSVLLGWAVLGEIVTGWMVGGMALIAAAFGLLIHQTLAAIAADALRGTPAAALLPGPASALCYAGSYVGRKFGLALIPDAPFATLVSAIAALGYYLVAAPFVPDYRRAFREAFVGVNRWQLVTAVLVSIGQVTVFAALTYTEVSRVAMIASLEIFLTTFLAVAVLKSERMPGPPTLVAALLATVGVVLVAGG